MSKHTPGPWAVERPYGEPGVYVTAANPRRSNPLVCRLVDQAQSPEGEANARLIAAAPDLLAACEAALASEPCVCAEIADTASAGSCLACVLFAAIAKAKGEADV